MSKQKTNHLVRIKYSKIHGNGGFAKKDIKKGTKLIQYIGKKITKAEAEKVSDIDGVFLFELDKKWDIDGNVPENTARFINHSCDPNCDFEIKNKQIWIRAMNDIKKGEELSYNYGFDLDGYKRYPCKCGAKNCAGFILDKDHWKTIKMKNKIKEIYKEEQYRPVGSFIVKSKDGKFLIVESAKSHHFWSFPQGGIEKNESLERNIKRELKEELGIKPSEIKMLREGFYIKELDIPEAKGRLRGFSKGKIYFFSLVLYNGNKKLNPKKDEIRKYLWVNKKKTLSKMFLNKRQLQKAEITKKALNRIK